MFRPKVGAPEDWHVLWKVEQWAGRELRRFKDAWPALEEAGGVRK
jgi:hypothetical protein